MGGCCFLNMLSFRFLCLACYLSTCSSYWACKEPELCTCMAGCDVLDGTTLKCALPLLVLPNLGIHWNSRLISQQVTWAKEKLAFEASKSYDAPWKDHVLGANKGAVTAFYGLLGISMSALKQNYI